MAVEDLRVEAEGLPKARQAPFSRADLPACLPAGLPACLRASGPAQQPARVGSQVLIGIPAPGALALGACRLRRPGQGSLVSLVGLGELGHAAPELSVLPTLLRPGDLKPDPAPTHQSHADRRTAVPKGARERTSGHRRARAHRLGVRRAGGQPAWPPGGPSAPPPGQPAPSGSWIRLQKSSCCTGPEPVAGQAGTLGEPHCDSVGWQASPAHGWFSGRILACHAGGPGSIPGPCRGQSPFGPAPRGSCARTSPVPSRLPRGRTTHIHAHAHIHLTTARPLPACLPACRLLLRQSPQSHPRSRRGPPPRSNSRKLIAHFKALAIVSSPCPR